MGLISAKSQIDRSQLNFNAKHPALFQWKHSVLELFLRYEHKKNNHEGTERVRNIVQEQFWIIGMGNASRSLKKHVHADEAEHKQ